MGKETSVAPKERVNIVYRPATGDQEESIELPLKTVVVGDFTGREDKRRVEERESINIDKDNFNEVLEAQDLSIDINVPNKLSDDPDAEMSFSVDFKSMKDFGPEAVAQKVPELKKILKLREALLALKGPLSNIPDFRNQIQDLISDEEKRENLLSELGLTKE
jgi:type VI secretion system protein ImpB